MDTETFLAHILSFEAKVQDCIFSFERTFGVLNPCLLWRQGKIPRVGKLNGSGGEYSMHGSGCTVEVSGRIVSFDFDNEGRYVYSPFKLVSFLDDESLSLNDIESLCERLASDGTLHVVEGLGMRLADGLSAKTRNR